MTEQLEHGEPSAIDLAGEDLVKSALEKGGSLPQIRTRIEAEKRRQELKARVEAKANEYLESDGEKGDWKPARLVLANRSIKLAQVWEKKGEVDDKKRQEGFTEWTAVQDQLDELDKAHGSLRDQFSYVEFASEILLREAFPLTRESEYLKKILS